ncbi:MAG: MBOAT family protein [Eubacteriales bacterium]|nr:MBOAT family protein [Eubacteriales bacterium]
MVFSSMVFLWVFLPIVFLLGMIIRKPRYQNIILLIASLIFYAWGEPRYILLLLISVALNWGFGLCIDRFSAHKKFFLVLSIIGNLGLLGYFKYCNFFLATLGRLFPWAQIPQTSIVLPIGISFFTFQAMSYVIDLYRGEYRVQKNPLNLALYISFFPQLIAGPIVKYRDIDEQIMHREISRQRIAEGFRRFLYGLGKKVIIANMTGSAVDKIFALDLAQMSGAAAWCGAILYTLQIYYDFSGYSDMAIGLGRMFGFDFLENFNYPYISSSIQEFWRRWHISLSTWFREYLYIPLGGNRRGKFRTYLNLWIVFAVTGLWHGASWNYVGWGLYHGFFIVIERMGFGKILKRVPVLGHIYAVIVFVIGWVFFRVESVRLGFRIVARMVMPWRYDGGGFNIMTLISSQTIFVAVCGILGCGILQTVFAGGKLRKIADRWKYSLPEAIFCVLLFLYCILLLAGNTYNPFIYFRF